MMSNTATMSNAGVSNAARDVAKDAKDVAKDAQDALKDATKAASDGVKDFQEDFDALRQDVMRLADQIAGLVSAKGNAAWTKAKSSVSGVAADVESKGQDAVDAALDLRDDLANTINDSIQTRPYTTLALALGIGFLFGATWRR